MKKVLIAVLAFLGAIMSVSCSGGDYAIKLTDENIVLEYGENTLIPEAFVVDGKGNVVSYRVDCESISAPGSEKIDPKAGSFVPKKVGEYKFNFTTPYKKGVTREVIIECRDTVKPKLLPQIAEEYFTKQLFDDSEFIVHDLPVLKTSDAAGIDVNYTSIKIYLNDKEVNITDDTFVLTEAGEIKFVISATDRNGNTATETFKSVSVTPEEFSEGCLSSFKEEYYLRKTSAGWLGSAYASEILESDTDSEGVKYEGVLKVSYPDNNMEAGFDITLGRELDVNNVQFDFVEVTMRGEGLGKEAAGNNVIIYEKSPYWENANLPLVLDGENWTTVRIPKDMIKAFVKKPDKTPEDTSDDVYGPLTRLRFETFGVGNKTPRTLYFADISYGFNAEEILLSDSEKEGSASAVYLSSDKEIAPCTEVEVVGKIYKNNERIFPNVTVVENNVICISDFNVSNGDKLFIENGLTFKIGVNRFSVGGMILRYNDGNWEVQQSIGIDGLGAGLEDIQRLYVHTDRNLFNNNAWVTLPSKGTVLVDGKAVNVTVQVCEWANDLIFDFGKAVPKDKKVIIPKGFEILCDGKTYVFMSEYSFYYSEKAADCWILGEHNELEIIKVSDSQPANDFEHLYLTTGTDILSAGNAWETLIKRGKVFLNGVEVPSATVQLCGWQNDIVITGFSAKEGDCLSLSRNFSVLHRGKHYVFDRNYEFIYSDGSWQKNEIFFVDIVGGSADKLFGKAGTEIVFTVDIASIPSGKIFDYWKINGEKIQGNEIVLSEDIIVEAVYKNDSTVYTVSVEGGTANIDSGLFGTLITLTSDTPQAGYKFLYWEVNNHRIDGNTFELKSNTVAVAVFTKIEEHTISVIGGSADKTYAVAGDTVTLTVNEEVIEAYHSLDYWTVNGEKIEGNTFVMPEEAVTVAAVYKENREVVTFSDSHVAGGVTTLYFNCSYDFNGPTERHLTMTTEGDVLVNGGKFGTHIETAGWSGALVIVNLSNLDFGATVQFKSGFTFLFENVKYVLEKDFTFFRMTDGWKLGTALVYGGLHTATNQNTVYTEWSNDIGTGMSADQTVRYIGEVTYNGVAMEATSVCTGWPGNIYLNNLNAANNETEKDRIVIEKGTCFLGAGNARYCATKTYEFVFDGTKWEIEEKNTLTVNTEGSTQTKLIFDVSFDLLSKGYQAGDEVELVSGGFEYKNTWNAPKNQPDFTLETLTGKVNEKGQIYFENLSVTLAEGHIVIVKKGTVIKAKTGSDVELSEAYAFRYVSYNPWSRVEITTMTGAEVSAASPNHNVYMTFDKAITVGKADNGALQLEANFVVHDGENYYGQHNNNAISVVRKAGDDYTALIGNVGPTEGNEVIIPAGTLFHANGIMYCTVEMYVINVNGTWNVR